MASDINPPSTVTYLGGLQWGILARLTVGADGVLVTPSASWLGKLGIPQLEFGWEQIDQVERVGIPFWPAARGVRFSMSSGRQLIFWTGTRARTRHVLDLCDERLPGRVSRVRRWPTLRR